jgi:hypothetical protein
MPDMRPEDRTERATKVSVAEPDYGKLRESANDDARQRSKWLSPTVIGLFAAAIGLIGNIVVAAYNNIGLKQVERTRLQSNLILDAIKTGSPDAACKNLSFFVSLGFLDDPQSTIRNCGNAPSQSPYLPVQIKIENSALPQRHLHEAPSKSYVLSDDGKTRVSVSYFRSDGCVLILRSSAGLTPESQWVCDKRLPEGVGTAQP